MVLKEKFITLNLSLVNLMLKKVQRFLGSKFIGIGIFVVAISNEIGAWAHPFQPNKVSAINEFYEFTLLGIQHILTGYDHLLFLIGLHIVDRKVGHIIKVVTAFTVAHSLTLGLAALDIFTLPVRPIESLIALSIAYIAVENLVLKQRPKKRWIVAFGFGLIHGFGFAGILKDIGLAETKLLISLFSFNIGVEIGQIGVVTLLFPILVVIRNLKWQVTFQRVTSAFILLLGLIWFVERSFLVEPDSNESYSGWTTARKAELDANFEGICFFDSNSGWAIGSEGTIAHTSNGGETWTIQNSSTNRYLFGTDFISNKEGWVVGEDGVILHTKDGGVNWHMQTSGTDAPFVDVDFVDTNYGWIVCMEVWIIHTFDGGNTWARQASGTYNELSAVHFINSKRGWITGVYGMVLHTTNGGKIWNLTKIPTGYEIIGAFFNNLETGWAVTTVGAVFETKDGGQTWNKRRGPQSRDTLATMSFVSPTEGWAAGWYGNIYQTSDGGQNWVSKSANTMNHLSDIYLLSSVQGWAVGENGVIIRTNDNGSNWEMLTSEENQDLTEMQFINLTEGWAVGYGGLILHTQDAGKTWETHSIDNKRVFVDDYHLEAVNFVERKKGWIVGGKNVGQFTHEGFILHTPDGGKTWELQFDEVETYLNDLVFVDDQNGWVIGGWFQEGQLFQTTDGGKTWKSQIVVDRSLNSIFFVTKRVGWIVGDGGLLLFTEDFGQTWKRKIISRYDGFSYDDISFVSEKEGWIVGDTGLILQTVDGGKNWERKDSNTDDPLHAIWFSSKKEGWIVGWKGVILRSVDAGHTWRREQSPTNKTLNSLWITRGKIPWVVGESGLILKYNRD